jgi:nucleoside-diphosphate-sugar epimerase
MNVFKKEIKIQGTGKETRSFCYVDDAIEATSQIIENKKTFLMYLI